MTVILFTTQALNPLADELANHGMRSMKNQAPGFILDGSIRI
jgi:hypothetical protein